MNTRTKRLGRLRKKPPPTDFTWDELISVMEGEGFEAEAKGTSHYTFYHANADVTATIARPHPSNELKRYQIKDAIEAIDSAQIWTTKKDEPNEYH